MKKLFALALTLTMVLSLAACGTKEETPDAASSVSAASSAAAASAEEAGITTVTPGKLTVATSPDFAPYEFYAIDENGDPHLAGFDMALAQYIADYLGLELEVIPMDFDGVLMELTTGSVDLGLAGLSPDPDREEVMAFSDAYYEGSQCFVTTSEKKELFPDLASLNNPDITVGAQVGSIQMDLAQIHSADAEIISLPKVTDILSELLTGKLDGAYTEEVVATSYKQNYPELEIACLVPYDVEFASVGVVKGNDALLAGVNEAIAAARSDGSMAAFVAEATEQATGNIHEGLLEG